MNIANNWNDYKILDMADGQKLERWGEVILARPDPQIIWKEKTYPQKWKNINATYHRSKTGGGAWEYKKKMPNQWQIKYKELTFNIKPMGFKHTGLFPEQAVNWDWMMDKIRKTNRDINGNSYGRDYDVSETQVGSATEKIVHPAFEFGGEQLAGIWSAKFEASMAESNNNTVTNNNTTNKTLKIVPNAESWRYIQVGN